eukprot:364272-Chlamydomonas_euryale.AAC.6
MCSSIREHVIESCPHAPLDPRAASLVAATPVAVLVRRDRPVPTTGGPVPALTRDEQRDLSPTRPGGYRANVHAQGTLTLSDACDGCVCGCGGSASVRVASRRVRHGRRTATGPALSLPLSLCLVFAPYGGAFRLSLSPLKPTSCPVFSPSLRPGVDRLHVYPCALCLCLFLICQTHIVSLFSLSWGGRRPWQICFSWGGRRPWQISPVAFRLSPPLSGILSPVWLLADAVVTRGTARLKRIGKERCA